MFKVGTAIIFRGNANDTLIPMIKSGIVTKVGRDIVWLDNAHETEDQVFAASLYPDTEECRNFLQDGIAMTLRHKAEQDAHRTITYQFNNDLIRKGLK